MIPAAAPAVSAVLALLIPAASATEPPMNDAPHALQLEVEQHGGTIEVRLTGASDTARQVSYTLEVTGQSTSRHRGSTTLAAGSSAVLSTMRASVGDDWCVKLVAEEAGVPPYEITRGPCDTAAD